jgi:hypothetical protein
VLALSTAVTASAGPQVVKNAPTITSGNAATFTVGSAGTFSVTATGLSTAITESGPLPGGVSFVDNHNDSATLSGTPATGTGGSYPISIRAANGAPPDATQSFTLTVDEAPSFTSADNATFFLDQGGDFTVMVDQGYPALTQLGFTGNLPVGMGDQVLAADGTISITGTPTGNAIGTYPLQLKANNGLAGEQDFTISVTKGPQQIAFSTPPSKPVVGETYAVTATGGGSGDPVNLSIDANASNICTLSSGTVTFNKVGSCAIDATQAGNADYADGSGAQTISVGPAGTASALTVFPTTIFAEVAPIAPGGGTPTGTVRFSVDGVVVGAAPLTSGEAVLTYTVPSGKSHTVAVEYQGSPDYTLSTGSTVRRDPVLTATLTSAHGPTKFHWYRSAVTVSFHCAARGAELTATCPKPVTLRSNGAAQTVTRKIAAADGGGETRSVRVNIDRSKPTVRITGVNNGQTFTGAVPKIHCVARDALSGVASCRLSRTSHGSTTTIKAIAIDRAGNTRRTSLTYRR